MRFLYFLCLLRCSSIFLHLTWNVSAIFLCTKVFYVPLLFILLIPLKPWITLWMGPRNRICIKHTYNRQKKRWKMFAFIIGWWAVFKFIVACITVVNMLRSVFISCLMCRKKESREKMKKDKTHFIFIFPSILHGNFSHCFSFHQQNAWCTCEMGCDDVDMMIIILFGKLRFSS